MPIAPYPDGTYPTCERHGEHAGVCWPCADERGRQHHGALWHVTCYEGRHSACDGSTSAPDGRPVQCACRCHAGGFKMRPCGETCEGGSERYARLAWRDMERAVALEDGFSAGLYWGAAAAYLHAAQDHGLATLFSANAMEATVRFVRALAVLGRRS